MLSRKESPLLQVSGLSVHFKPKRSGQVIRAVDGVDLEVYEGETLCLVGESGSGKTTLVQAFGHLVSIASGTVSFGDVDVAVLSGSKLRAHRRDVQYVFQDPFQSFNPRHSVWDIVSEPIKVHRLTDSREELQIRVFEALDECGLRPADEFARLFPHQLSGGQRQRVAIAAAIVLRPQLLIADEAVSMLDVSVRSDILKLFLRLKHNHNMTLVFVTHDLSVAWEIADRIFVMYLGKIMEGGSPSQVIGSPANPYTHALVSAIPVPDPREPVREVAVKGDIGNVLDDVDGCRFCPRCPHAIDRCATSTPPLEVLSEGHVNACIRSGQLSLVPPHQFASDRSEI
jgi:oligopeptide/dipeptide ABC transporter ATP-binding protein